MVVKLSHYFIQPVVLPLPKAFAGGVTGVLLMLCLWLAEMAMAANAATGGTVVALGNNYSGQTNVPAGLSGVTAMAAGLSFIVALKSDGTVVAWGGNYGQTNVPAGLSGVAAIAAGPQHTVALKSDGTVVAWGGNDYGQTTGTPTPYWTTANPVILNGQVLSGVTATAAGDFHTVALKSDGTVVAWGDGTYGQTNVPAGLSGVTAIAARYVYTVALKSNGTVVAWGNNNYGQTNVPPGLSGVTAVAPGGLQTVALKSDGTVVAWGHNSYGQTNVPAGLSGVTAIAAGYDHTVALKSDGKVVAWGNNNYGQTNVPPGLSGVTAVAAGYYHTVALKSDGTVVVWGDNNYGQTNVPAGLNGVTAIAAGYYHSVALVSGVLPSITAQPVNAMVNVTSNTNFSVTATGTAPLNYQWLLNGTNLTGAISATLNLSNVQTNQAGNYTVVITNAYGSVTSSVAVLTVQSANLASTQRTATITGTCLSIILRSNNITSGGVPANIHWTTYDGSTATPPLRQAIGTGLYLYSGEFRPRGGGAYETDYSTLRNDNGSYLQYGSLVLNLPTTDSDANGVPDVVQVDKAVGVGVTGTTQQDFPSASSQALSGTITRNAGTNVGTYSIVDTATGGTAVNISGLWEAQFFTGTLQYTRGTFNSATVAIARTNYGVAFSLTGLASFTVPSASQMNFPQFTLTNLVDGTVYTVQASTFTRSGSNFTGSFQFVDGDMRTAWADHLNWVFQIADPNDTDTNGIPDLSDAVTPTIMASTTGNTLTLFWTDTVAGYRVESASGLTPTVTWNNVTGTFQTNSGFISIGLPISGARKFYRLVKP